MLTKIQGLVIRSVKYGETSLIFDMYTRQYGLASFIVNGARRPKSKLPSSLFQLMNWLEMIVYMKDPRSLSRVKEVQMIHYYQNIPFDLHKRSVGLFMTEVIQKSINENEPNTQLFSFLQDAYLYLDQSTDPVMNFHISFLFELSAYLGFRPSGEWSETNPLFHLVSGNFVNVAHPLYTLDHSLSKVISDYLTCPKEEGHLLKVPRDIRHEVLDQMISFFRYHLDRLPEIKTHRILAEVFS